VWTHTLSWVLFWCPAPPSIGIAVRNSPVSTELIASPAFTADESTWILVADAVYLYVPCIVLDTRFQEHILYLFRNCRCYAMVFAVGEGTSACLRTPGLSRSLVHATPARLSPNLLIKYLDPNLDGPNGLESACKFLSYQFV
jgi:hypothetical protein